MNTVTIAIQLPVSGTPWDYQQAITAAITANSGNGLAQHALGMLLAQITVPRSQVFAAQKQEAEHGR
jgi:hypothetical protein